MRGKVLLCVCVLRMYFFIFLCIFYTCCKYTEFSCPTWVCRLRSASFCCCWPQPRVVARNYPKNHVLLLTPLFLARHKCETFTATVIHSYFRLGRWWFCRSDGWGTSILLLNSPHDCCRNWCSWNTLSFEDSGITSALQFLEKEASPLELPPVPLCLQRHLDDKGVVC